MKILLLLTLLLLTSATASADTIAQDSTKVLDNSAQMVHDTVTVPADSRGFFTKLVQDNNIVFQPMEVHVRLADGYSHFDFLNFALAHSASRAVHLNWKLSLKNILDQKNREVTFAYQFSLF